MKLIMDEKVKHRLIGLAVILSIGAIFAPALLKKSSQNLESHYSAQVKLPPKPTPPNVVISTQAEMFKTIKIAKVNLPAVTEEDRLPQLAKAEILHSDTATDAGQQVVAAADELPAVNSVATQNEPVKPVLKQVIKARQVATRVISKIKVKPVAWALNKKKLEKKPRLVALKKNNVAKMKFNTYSVQVAAFAQQGHAQALVNKLRGKAYKADLAVIGGRNGRLYKVFAGHSLNKEQALKYKAQLASAMSLNAIIINTGVS